MRAPRGGEPAGSRAPRLGPRALCLGRTAGFQRTTSLQAQALRALRSGAGCARYLGPGARCMLAHTLRCCRDRRIEDFSACDTGLRRTHGTRGSLMCSALLRVRRGVWGSGAAGQGQPPEGRGGRNRWPRNAVPLEDRGGRCTLPRSRGQVCAEQYRAAQQRQRGRQRADCRTARCPLRLENVRGRALGARSPCRRPLLGLRGPGAARRVPCCRTDVPTCRTFCVPCLPSAVARSMRSTATSLKP